MKAGIQKERSARMKDGIINAALDLCAEKGHENVTVAEIAERAGCTPGNIYHYFRSKDEILAHSNLDLDRDYLAFDERLRTAEFEDYTPYEKLLAFQRELYRACSVSELGKEYYIYGFKYPESTAIKLDEHRASTAIYRRLVQACMDSGEFHTGLSVDEIVRCINIINRGAFVEWVLNDRENNLLECGMQVSEAFYRGLRKDG